MAVEYAVRYPDDVARLVLICPSGMGDEEKLPIVEGMRRSDPTALVESVFHDPRRADPGLFPYYRRQLGNRRWRTGLLRTIRGTMSYTVCDRLHLVRQPTLLIAGREDQIVDPIAAEAAARRLPQGQYRSIPNCGHAPHLEKSWTINRLVVNFLTHPEPTPRSGSKVLLPALSVSEG